MKKTLISSSPWRRYFNFQELWQYRELLFFLVWRNLRVRYSQAIIGIFWVILQPVLTMLIFSFLFGRFAKLPSEGVPYAIFVFTALLPWTLFANSVSAAGISLINNSHLITKVYLPRIIIPLARIIENTIDFFISSVVLFGLLLFYKIIPGKTLLFFPVFLLWAVILALGTGLWLAALNIKYRDVGYATPFLMQILFYASPVAYSFSLIPNRWRLIYSLNPIVGVIEGFRWCILGKGVDLAVAVPISLAITAIIFMTGMAFFLKTERTFADII